MLHLLHFNQNVCPMTLRNASQGPSTPAWASPRSFLHSLEQSRVGSVSPSSSSTGTWPWPRGHSPGCCLLEHPSDPCPILAARRGPQPLTVSSSAPCSWMTVSSMLAAACARKVLVEPSPSMVVRMRWPSSANVRCFMASCSSEWRRHHLGLPVPRPPPPLLLFLCSRRPSL